MKLGEALKKYRQDKGLSITKMAEEVGITHDDYEAAELGGMPTVGLRKWLDAEPKGISLHEVDDYPPT